jgi:hypothetical protein
MWSPARRSVRRSGAAARRARRAGRRSARHAACPAALQRRRDRRRAAGRASRWSLPARPARRSGSRRSGRGPRWPARRRVPWSPPAAAHRASPPASSEAGPAAARAGSAGGPAVDRTLLDHRCDRSAEPAIQPEIRAHGALRGDDPAGHQRIGVPPPRCPDQAPAGVAAPMPLPVLPAARRYAKRGDRPAPGKAAPCARIKGSLASRFPRRRVRPVLGLAP